MKTSNINDGYALVRMGMNACKEWGVWKEKSIEMKNGGMHKKGVKINGGYALVLAGTKAYQEWGVPETWYAHAFWTAPWVRINWVYIGMGR